GSRYGEAYYYMGEIYIRQSKFNHADIAFTQAVKTEPLKDYWWTRLGYAREMSQNYEIALEAYEQAITLNPYRTEAKNGKERVSKFLQ
ncbi:MAG: tetratricopeptide repeat protein, partial [Spirochaetaceae bacterium]|nr:tetratricopeptide repeat protein [Spirochaetaceae bacterium]